MIGDKLKQLRTKKHFTVNQLCEKLEMTPSTYTKYERDERDVSTEILMKFANFYGVSADYLLGRETPPPNPYANIPAEEQEIRMIETFVNLDPSTRRAILAAMDALIADPKFQEAMATNAEQEEVTEIIQTIFVKFFPDTVSAGTGTDLLPDSGNAEPLKVKKTPIAEKADFAVRVRGDSMTPTFDNNDIVLVREQDVEKGEIGVFQMNGEGYIKELGDMELISHNPAYPPIPVTAELNVKGKVLGKAEPIE